MLTSVATTGMRFQTIRSNRVQNAQKGHWSHPPTRRAETRYSTGKAAASEAGEEVHTKLCLTRSLRSHASG